MKRDWALRTPRSRVPYWTAVPVGAYLAFHVLFALEEDMAAAALGAAWLAAGVTGAYAKRKTGMPAWQAAVAGAWFPVLLAWGRVYWKLGVSSPASAAQRLVEAFGWRYPPAAAALAACLLPAGLLGHWAAAFDLWWERKTGRPFFEVEE